MSEFRYVFTVRQRFGEIPVVDTFYQVRVPSGITGDQAKIMDTLSSGNFYREELEEDNAAIRGISLRLRFNSDMYPNVCLVRTQGELDAETLELIVQQKHNDGDLMNFLKESELNR